MSSVWFVGTKFTVLFGQLGLESSDFVLYGSTYQPMELSAAVILTGVAVGLRVTITPGERGESGFGRRKG